MTTEKGPHVLCGQHGPCSACAFVQAQVGAPVGLDYTLTESVDTVVYVDERRSDQTARMRMLIWTYLVRKLHKSFSYIAHHIS